MIQNKLCEGKLGERDYLAWSRNNEFNFYLQVHKKFVLVCLVCVCVCVCVCVKNVTVQLYTLMNTKHKLRGNGLQFVLDTLHGDKVLNVVSKGYHSERGVHPKTFRIYLPKVDRGSNYIWFELIVELISPFHNYPKQLLGNDYQILPYSF